MNLARYNEPSRRRLLMLPEGEERRAWIAPTVECHLLFSSNRSTQNQTDRSISATDSNVAAENAATATDGAIAIGANAAYLERGAVGRDQNIEGGVSIVTSDPATVQAALNLARDLAIETAAVAKESSDSSRFLAGESVAALSAVKEAEIAGGAALWRNVVTVLGVSVAAVLAIKFWRKA